MLGFGNNQPPVQEAQNESGDVIAQQAQEISNLSNQVNQAMQGISRLTGMMENMQARSNEQTAAANIQPEQPMELLSGLGPDQLENLTLPELVSKMEGQTAQLIDRSLTKAMEPLVGKLDAMAAQNNSQFAGNAIENFKQGRNAEGKLLHPDFEDWRPEMTDLAKQYPGMNLTDLYAFARSKNQSKVAELDQKYNPKGETTDPFNGEFGGFKAGQSQSYGQTDSYSLKDAGSAALGEIVSSEGSIPAPSDSIN
jgi:hypothetical protein